MGSQELNKQFQTFQGGNSKILANNTNAPRNSYTKRTFGRDLSNLQPNNTTNENGKQ